MSKLGAFAEAILRGGLPAALDQGRSAGTATGDTKPEQTAPRATIVDRDTSSPVKPTSVLDHFTAKEWTIAAVGGVVVITVLFFAIRGAARIK